MKRIVHIAFECTTLMMAKIGSSVRVNSGCMRSVKRDQPGCKWQGKILSQYEGDVKVSMFSHPIIAESLSLFL